MEPKCEQTIFSWRNYQFWFARDGWEISAKCHVQRENSAHPMQHPVPAYVFVRMIADPKLLSQKASTGSSQKFFQNIPLSSIEERGAGISQRTKPILERFGRPDVVAIEADVFPAERADVGEKRVGQKFASSAKLGDGVAEIDGVPEGDGGDREVETRGPR